jgi:formyl-CoA transferase
MSGALQDVLVVDLTSTFWGAVAAAMLGDFGADVIKIEALNPRARRFEDLDADPVPSDWNSLFELANRNKRSVAIDLDKEGGRKLALDLTAKADVIVTDRALEWLNEREFDYAACAGRRPDVIYVRGSAFGASGPDKDATPLDELAAARTGMMPILVQPEQPPVFPGHGRMYTSVMLALGTLAALIHRRATGEGQQVDSSLLAGNMYGASLDLQAFLAIGGERFLHPVSRLDAGNPMSGTQYPTSDGLWAALTMPDTDRWWPVLAEITGLDVNDSRFATHDLRCGEHRLTLMDLLDKAIRKKPASHWRDVFNEKQMSADVIEDYRYPAADEMARDNRYILDLEDPSLGRVSMLGFPIFMADTPASLGRTAPALGQHTAEVLHDLLDCAPTRFTELVRTGVVA